MIDDIRVDPKQKRKSNAVVFPKGIDRSVVERLSKLKKEPKWVLESRLLAYEEFIGKKTPQWGPDLREIDYDQITYYASVSGQVKSWEEVPEDVRDTFDKLGIPEHEKKFLAGVSTQYESEVVYHSLLDRYSDTGLVFESIDEGLKKYPDIFKQYFGKLIPASDNKFAALNSAVWSGGSFLYVPKGVKVQIPVETYFRINREGMGQFERTLIIADEGSEVHYIEGCTAPQYSTNALHAAVVELFALKDSRIRYTTIQNWSKNVYNLVTKRAIAYENARVEWLDVNLGSKVTMKYPSVILKGDNSSGEVLSMAMAEDGQVLDTGAKMTHIGRNSRSVINSKTVSVGSGKAVYRGITKITPDADNSSAFVGCDGLLVNDNSKSYAYPNNILENSTSTLEHEANVSKIAADKLAYITSRGIDEESAKQLIVSGFIDPVVRELPLEYSVELERLVGIIMNREGKGHQKK